MPPTPHFLVIGAQKAGTTWLARHLGEHPGVFSPARKELHYFDKKIHWARGAQWYGDWFASARPHQICGEYTPNYLWEPTDPAEIAESQHLPGVAPRACAHNPGLRWIAVLRDPVNRAVSAYYHHIRARRVRPDERLASVWHRFGIRSMGLYAQQLKPWFDTFPAEQGRVLFFESDILARPVETLRDLYAFLGLDPAFRPSGLDKVDNPGSSHFLLRLEHRAPLLARFIQKINRRFGASWQRFHIPVLAEEVITMREFFRPANEELKHLLENLRRTGYLPAWLTDAPPGSQRS
jgi:hypothetical protein